MLPQVPVDAANEAAQPCIQAIPALWMGGSREHVAGPTGINFTICFLPVCICFYTKNVKIVKLAPRYIKLNIYFYNGPNFTISSVLRTCLKEFPTSES